MIKSGGTERGRGEFEEGEVHFGYRLIAISPHFLSNSLSDFTLL